MKTLTFRFKGGPGSGHKDHKGIPGHQGGSLPEGSNVAGLDKLTIYDFVPNLSDVIMDEDGKLTVNNWRELLDVMYDFAKMPEGISDSDYTKLMEKFAKEYFGTSDNKKTKAPQQMQEPKFPEKKMVKVSDELKELYKTQYHETYGNFQPISMFGWDREEVGFGLGGDNYMVLQANTSANNEYYGNGVGMIHTWNFSKKREETFIFQPGGTKVMIEIRGGKSELIPRISIPMAMRAWVKNHVPNRQL